MTYAIPTVALAEWLAFRNQGEKIRAKPDAFELDWWLTTDDAAFDKLISALSAELETVIPRRRHHAHRLPNLRALIASLFDAHDREPGKPTKYARKPAAYSDNLEDRPAWASCKILVSLVDGLARLGYVDSRIGRNDDFSGMGILSLVWPLEGLTTLFDRYGIKRSIFLQDNSRLPIVLRAPKKGSKHGKRLRHGACIGAEAEITQAAEIVTLFNELLTEHEITLGRLPDGMEDKQRVNLARTACHRVFNNVNPANPKLDQGGRFYGGGWLSLGKELRPYLLIDGQPTVELDFGGLHIRMLYHLDKLTAPEHPYEIPGLSRKTAKVVVNNLINATSRQISKASQAPKGEIETNWKIRLPDGLQLNDVVDQIRAHHAPVAHHFGRGEGLRLQNLDSRICETVLGSAIPLFPILPVHDSFVVQAEEEEVARRMMEAAYWRVVGPFVPDIKVKRRPGREPLRVSSMWEEIKHTFTVDNNTFNQSLVSENIRSSNFLPLREPVRIGPLSESINHALTN